MWILDCLWSSDFFEIACPKYILFSEVIPSRILYFFSKVLECLRGTSPSSSTTDSPRRETPTDELESGYIAHPSRLVVHSFPFYLHFTYKICTTQKQFECLSRKKIFKTRYSLLSVDLVSMLFSLQFLRCFQGEFSSTIKSLFSWWSFLLFIMCDIVGRN